MKVSAFMLAVFLGLASSVVCEGAVTDGPGSLKFLIKSCRSLEKGTSDSPLTAEEFAQSAYCSGYLSGVGDALGSKPHEPLSLCVPKGAVTLEQLMLVFLKWVDENPEKLHWHPYTAASLALSRAFPCDKP